MPDVVQFWLLFVAVTILGILVGALGVLLLKLMGDIEKFGRLLLKLRRHLKSNQRDHE